MIFNDGANFFVVLAGSDEVHGLDPAIVGGLEKFSCRVVGGRFSAHDEHFGAVSVVAVEIDGDV